MIWKQNRKFIPHFSSKKKKIQFLMNREVNGAISTNWREEIKDG